MRDGNKLRHEDMTHLSFPDRMFDAIVTMDVFEHIPDYCAAFRECNRTLRTGGGLVFSIPFFPHQDKTHVRAVIENGTVHHIEPPEYHGNPLGDGSLCFQHFGWDIFDSLRRAGFKKATAHLYWGPWQGHFGTPFFVFHAEKV
jgi:SAM-dependent methyltransferase